MTFIPEDVHFKVSAHSGHGNPCSAHILEKLGADSINPVRDIQLQMLASMRATIDVPIDLHTRIQSLRVVLSVIMKRSDAYGVISNDAACFELFG